MMIFDPARSAAGQPGARGSARFVALTPELLRLLELREGDETFGAMLGEVAIVGALVRHAWAMLDGPHVLATGGAVATAQGRALGWLVFSRHARFRHVLLAARFGRARFAELIERGVFQRIEATVRVEFAGGHHVAERIGLSREGLMRRYVDGVDHVLYAMVKP